MAKRLSHNSDSDESYDDTQSRKVARQQQKRITSKPLYRAVIKEVADHGGVLSGNAASGVDDNIMQRIKRCLSLAHHAGTPEAEAKAALHMATRLMSQYNVSQADVLATESDETRQQHAGHSVVSIQRSDNDWSKIVLHQAYVDDLMSAMEKFFDCKSYTTKRLCRLDVTFYGIRQNTTIAAYSFEMVYNQANDWARAYKGGNPRNSYLLGLTSSLNLMAQQEMDAEEERARRAEAEALKAREENEERERQERLNRLAPLPLSSTSTYASVEDAPEPELKQEPEETGYPSTTLSVADMMLDNNSSNDMDLDNDYSSWDGFSSSDDEADDEHEIEPDFIVGEEDHIDPLADFENELKRFVKPDPETTACNDPLSVPLAGCESGVHGDASLEIQPTVQRGEQGENAEHEWASHMQLVVFRQTAKEIADRYLRNQGRKLKRGAARSHLIRDRRSYACGQEDGKKIDVHRQRIEEAKSDGNQS